MEAHRLSPAAPDYTASNHFVGWGGGRARGTAVSPMLQKHVADNLRDEAAVAKEARKAAEERGARRKNKGDKYHGKNNNGGKKGDTEGGAP